jgi:hypothetical protein
VAAWLWRSSKATYGLGPLALFPGHDPQVVVRIELDQLLPQALAVDVGLLLGRRGFLGFRRRLEASPYGLGTGTPIRGRRLGSLAGVGIERAVYRRHDLPPAFVTSLAAHGPAVRQGGLSRTGSARCAAWRRDIAGTAAGGNRICGHPADMIGALLKELAESLGFRRHRRCSSSSGPTSPPR